MTRGPAVDAVLGAVLTNRGGYHLDDFDLDLAETVRLFTGPISGPGIGHLAEARRDRNRLALVVHVRNNQPDAAELLDAIDTGLAPGLDVQLAGGGGPPGVRRRPRLVALRVNHLLDNAWPGSELTVLDRHGALSPSETLAARRASRSPFPPRPVTILDRKQFGPRPVADLTPVQW